MWEDQPPQWLLDELNRLASVKDRGAFRFAVDADSLPRKEQSLARLLGRALDNALREMQEAQATQVRREKIFDNLNRAAVSLLEKTEGEFEEALSTCVNYIAKITRIDRMSISRNIEKPDGLYASQIYRWSGQAGAALAPLDELRLNSYDRHIPRWRDVLASGESISGPVRLMPEAEILQSYGCVVVLAIPVFHKGGFWGFVLFENLTEEQAFPADETAALHAASLMLVNAVIRYEAAQKIRKNDEYARLLLDSSPLCCRLWSRDYTLVACNEAAVRLFGLKNKQEYLDRYFELAPEVQPDGRTTRERAIAQVEKAFRQGICRDLFLYTMPDGSPLPAENTLVRIPYGGEYVVASYSRDLREQEAMLDAIGRQTRVLQTMNHVSDMLLRAEPDEFETTLQHCMSMLACSLRVDRMYIMANRDEDGPLRFTLLHETIGDNPLLRNVNWARDAAYDDAIPGIKEALLRGEFVHSKVCAMPPADRAWFEARGAHVGLVIPVWMRGQFRGLVGFDNCRSEAMAEGDDLSAMLSGGLLVVTAILRNEGFLRLRDASVKLEEALADARDANNAKSDFLATMSHELRTPLNAVIGFSQLALAGDMPEALRNKVEKIHTAGVTILGIIEDILDIAKIESGKFSFHPDKYDSLSLINDVVTLTGVNIGDKPIAFRLFVDENLPEKLYGDALRVKQIFNNLLSNAFKYTHSGTVEWRVSFKREDAAVWIVSTVRDTGIGIRPEDRSKLFSGYYQAGERSVRHAGGTGLGLPITKRLAEMMHGSVSLESTFGEGTTVSVRLRQGSVSAVPIGKDAAEKLMAFQHIPATLARTAAIARINLSYAHVLIVDDLGINHEMMKGILRRYELGVDCAFSGQQAVAMIRAGSPRYSAVFMDHMMPGMDGVETLRIIREEIGTEYARNLPVIALTANALVGNEEIFLSRGFQAFLSKPIDWVKLDAVLRRWVRDTSLEQALPAIETSLPGGVAVDGLDMPQVLRSVGGDRAALVNVLRAYAADIRSLLRDMKEYLAAGKLAEYAIAAHGVKGASNIVCAPEPGRLAEGLEQAAQSGDVEAVTDGHPPFARKVEALLGGIDAMLGGISVAEKPVAAAPDIALLRRLRDACADFDMSGVDAAMEALESFRYESGGGLVLWLREKVNAIAYEEISGMVLPDSPQGTSSDHEQ